MNKEGVIKELAGIYRQLYLDPDIASEEEYKSVVQKGDRPADCSLCHFRMDERDSAEYIDTPAGRASVITLYDRHDFETFIRCMLAVRKGPDYKVPPTMGASTIVAFNWPRIEAHREAFYKEQKAAGIHNPDWGSEFSRFTEKKENYQDMLIVLSRGPYSNISAEQINNVLSECGIAELTQEEWTDRSDSIRKYHELTHFVCRKLYPEKINAIWDELVADAAGIYAAFGEYSKRAEELFLGITDGRYTGGRLENYTEEGTDIDVLAGSISDILTEFEKIISTNEGADIFDLMLKLEAEYDRLSSFPDNKITSILQDHLIPERYPA